MRVAFLCRGYPGLGKVVGALGLAQGLGRRRPAAEALFFSYYQGRDFLASQGLPVVDLLEGAPDLRPGEFLAPFGLATRRLAEELEDFAPDLVVNDGEPYLVPVTREVLGRPTLVLAHPLDLENPRSTRLAVGLFRHYYARADRVLVHGLRAVPEAALDLGGRAGAALPLPTIVRDDLAHGLAPPPAADAPLVAVLGGGVRNASEAFRAGTLELGSWVLRAARESSPLPVAWRPGNAAALEELEAWLTPGRPGCPGSAGTSP